MSKECQNFDFDFIVVGAGTTGCALAARLSERPGIKVLLLEAGPKDASNWFHIPIGYYKTVGNPKYDWGYRSEPEGELHDRTIAIPRGRVVGGCGAINGLCYLRGQHADYDGWRASGAIGWGWSDVAPIFERLEGFREGGGELGKDGPIGLSLSVRGREICEAFLTSAEASGLPRRRLFNGEAAEGFAYTLTTVEDGRRSSTAATYLRPALKQQSLKLETDAHCETILFTGKRAVGVRYRKGRHVHEAYAGAEIILAAGTFNSPQILNLSGIGDPESLTAFGINIVHALPDVGRNLQEHFLVELQYQLGKPVSLNDDIQRLAWKINSAFRWLVSRNGPLTEGPAPVIGYARSSRGVERPDIQFHFVPATLSEDRRPHTFSGVSVDVYQTRPRSRGEVSLRSPDPFDKPRIAFRFLSCEEDRRITIAAIRKAREIARQKPFADYVERELAPSEACHTDEELLAFARERGFFDYHPVGTCRMGVDDGAVVDPRLRVRGVEGLRVADCSIMPEIVSSNTNACAIMIGEKAAEMIVEDRC